MGKSHFEKMLAGEDYIASQDPKIEAAYRRALELSKAYEKTYLIDPPAARKILQELIPKLGEEVEIRPPLYVDYGFNLEIGAKTFINFGLTALDPGKIKIGENCQIGPNVQLLTPTHPMDAELRKTGLEGSKPITIGAGVWLGGAVVVCPGVTIGENSVIGAGAVVTKDIAANSLAVGNPASVIKRL